MDQWTQPRAREIPFSFLLYRMAGDPRSDIVAWHESGKALLVNEDRFRVEIHRFIPEYFRMCSLDTFLQLLTAHKFYSLKSNSVAYRNFCVPDHPEILIYRHEHFQRDKPNLLVRIKSDQTDTQSERIGMLLGSDVNSGMSQNDGEVSVNEPKANPGNQLLKKWKLDRSLTPRKIPTEKIKANQDQNATNKSTEDCEITDTDINKLIQSTHKEVRAMFSKASETNDVWSAPASPKPIIDTHQRRPKISKVSYMYIPDSSTTQPKSGIVEETKFIGEHDQSFNRAFQFHEMQNDIGINEGIAHKSNTGSNPRLVYYRPISQERAIMQQNYLETNKIHLQSSANSKPTFWNQESTHSNMASTSFTDCCRNHHYHNNNNNHLNRAINHPDFWFNRAVNPNMAPMIIPQGRCTSSPFTSNFLNSNSNYISSSANRDSQNIIIEQSFSIPLNRWEELNGGCNEHENVTNNRRKISESTLQRTTQETQPSEDASLPNTDKQIDHVLHTQSDKSGVHSSISGKKQNAIRNPAVQMVDFSEMKDNSDTDGEQDLERQHQRNNADSKRETRLTHGLDSSDTAPCIAAHKPSVAKPDREITPLNLPAWTTPYEVKMVACVKTSDGIIPIDPDVRDHIILDLARLYANILNIDRKSPVGKTDIKTN